MYDRNAPKFEWRALYRCLVCGRVLPFGETALMSEVVAAELAAWFGDHSKEYKTYRKVYPRTVVHNCFGDSSQVGAAVFSGFVKCKEEKSSNQEGEHENEKE